MEEFFWPSCRKWEVHWTLPEQIRELWDCGHTIRPGPGSYDFSLPQRMHLMTLTDTLTRRNKPGYYQDEISLRYINMAKAANYVAESPLLHYHHASCPRTWLDYLSLSNDSGLMLVGYMIRLLVHPALSVLTSLMSSCGKVTLLGGTYTYITRTGLC